MPTTKQVSDFKPDSLVQFLTGGPVLVVCGPAKKNPKQVECAYYNEVSGLFEVCSFTPGLLKDVK